MKPRKNRRESAEKLNNTGLGKVINNFHNNTLVPGIKRNVEFWKGVGAAMRQKPTQRKRGR